MPKGHPIARDIPRLLALKQQVRETVLGDDTASSIAAFIAWKALLLASMSEEGQNEADRLRRTVERCLRDSAQELRPALDAFVGGLRRLSGKEITPALREEWLRKPEDLGEEVERVLRSVKRLASAIPDTRDDQLWTLAPAIAEHLRHVRHVVIGHARVTTGTPLFPMIVRPFEDLVAHMALLKHRELNS